MAQTQETSGDGRDLVFRAVIKQISAEEGRVTIFLEGIEGPVGEVRLSPFCDPAYMLFDRALLRWVTDGGFRGTVSDPDLLAILGKNQTERLAGVPWYRLGHRFLPVDMSFERLTFRLTSDKTDLSPRHRRMLEVGEEVVLREEREQEEAAARARAEAERHDAELRSAHATAIEELALAAIEGRTLRAESVAELKAVGLLKPTTTFRAAHFGESWILKYEFRSSGTLQMGFLGFDEGFKLVKLDRREPAEPMLF